jgi:hypothetical protein
MSFYAIDSYDRRNDHSRYKTAAANNGGDNGARFLHGERSGKLVILWLCGSTCTMLTFLTKRIKYVIYSIKRGRQCVKFSNKFL